MKPVGQRTVIDDGVPGRRGRRPHARVFGLPDPLPAMSPVHIPRGFTKAYIAGEVVEDLGGADPRRARDVRADHDVLLIEGTGHAGRRRRDRPVERGGGGDARRAGGHRQRGRRRPADRRDRAQRLALRARTASRSPARSSTRSIDAQPGIGDPASAASRATASRCSACCRTGRSSRTRRSAWSSRASTARCSTRARTSTGSSAASRSGRWSPSHMLERIGPGSLVIVPGDREDVIDTTIDRDAPRARRSRRRRRRQPAGALGLVLTGGYRPRAGHRRDPAGGPVRHARARRHVRRRLRGPRPAGQDPPRRRGRSSQSRSSSGSTWTSTGSSRRRARRCSLTARPRRSPPNRVSSVSPALSPPAR